MTRYNDLALFVIILMVAGCDLEGDNNPIEPTTAGVIVANQGNFSDANGSLTVFDLETGDTDAVANLGSIVQSISIAGGRLYVMANSANRVDVFDLETLQQVAQIDNVTSPRYMAVIGNKGYVTNLFGAPDIFTGGTVTVLDLASNTKGTEIQVGDNPEGLALVGNRLYVANHGFGEGRSLNVIDTNSNTVIDSVDVDCDGPRFLAADRDGDVFVFCTGRTIYDEGFNVIGETNGAVRILDGASGTIISRIDLDGRIGTAGPGQDAFYSPEVSLIFAVQDESTILAFDTNTNAQSGELGPLAGDPIGAIAFDGITGHLYIGRNAGFTAAGQVTIHLGDGSQVGSFQAGVAPAFILPTTTP